MSDQWVNPEHADIITRMMAEQQARSERLREMLLQPIDDDGSGFITFTRAPEGDGPVSTGVPPEV